VLRIQVKHNWQEKGAASIKKKQKICHHVAEKGFAVIAHGSIYADSDLAPAITILLVCLLELVALVNTCLCEWFLTDNTVFSRTDFDVVASAPLPLPLLCLLSEFVSQMHKQLLFCMRPEGEEEHALIGSWSPRVNPVSVTNFFD
jgi:hypothetical protein